MIFFNLINAYDSFGGDDKLIIGVFDSKEKAEEAANKSGFETRDWKDYHDGDFDIKCLWIEKVSVTNKIEDWWIHRMTMIYDKGEVK